MPPTVLAGRYHILSSLGAGGMGEVFLAEDSSLDRQVAVKLLSDSASEDIVARKRLQYEARAAGALDHPFICRVYDIGEADGHLFVVMEYVKGETLRVLGDRGLLPMRHVIDIAHELAQALDAVHRLGIVHRDLKPANVMVMPDGHVKVMDFGLAKRVVPRSGRASGSDADTVLTDPGTLLGTPRYMSPEQVRGESVDRRSDLFSLGVILHELATGRHPFLRVVTAETMAAILVYPPEPGPRNADEIVVGFGAIISRMLAKAPALRHQDTAELLADVKALLARVGSSSSPSSGAGQGPTAERTQFVGRHSETAELTRLDPPERPRSVANGEDVWMAIRAWLRGLGKYRTPHNVQALIDSGRIGSPKLVVADVVLDDPWDDTVGLDQIDFEWRAESFEGMAPAVWATVLDARTAKLQKLEAAREKNKRKLFFTSYDPPVIDQGRRVRFQGGTYDFGWSDSMKACAATVQAAILGGGLNPEHLPRRFDNHIVAVTSDRKVLLGLRSRGIATPKHWMVSLGESYDPDIHGDATVDVTKFVQQTLCDSDELNIELKVATGATILALGVGTEWDSMMGNILCYVKLPVPYSEVRRRFKEGEFLDIDGMEFTINNCLKLVRQGQHFTVKYPDPRDLVPCSVMTLLLALRVEFGEEPLMAALST